MNIRNNSGFGTLGIILVIVVVAVVALGGWYVYNKNNTAEPANNSNQQTNNNANQNNNQTPVADPSEGGKYLVLSEWGVRLKPAIQLPKMTYAISTSDGLSRAVFTFPDLPADCAQYYWLSRAKADQDIDGFGNTPTQLIARGDHWPKTIKKVGDYYFYLGHGQASCSADDTVIQRQNSYAQQLRGANDDYSVELIPSSD